ncbi:MAG: agmatine deiminase family protein [Verrucomicrobiota bacterium]
MKSLRTIKKGRMAAATFGLATLAVVGGAPGQEIETWMPAMEERHEGTWLQWPHHHTYGRLFRDDVDPQWVEMTRALVGGENVHIVAYNATERNRIIGLLNAAGVSLERVDFVIQRTDDFWVRDNGPIFVFDGVGTLKMTDWGFDGWGDDTPFANDDVVPAAVATATGIPLVDLNAMVLEGGAVELDGNGVLMATRSSILEPNRNPGMTQAEAEAYLRTHLGAEKFIWLDGADGGTEDITDMHIDGFAMFAQGGRIVTMSQSDLLYWGLSNADINVLYAATDIDNQPYQFVYLPLTSGNVVTTYGQNLGFKGSYVNYYVGNDVVLMPSYSDPNDAAAKAILEGVYPNRTVVPIDCRNLYANGGMVHCVTQQQPEVPDNGADLMELGLLRVDVSEVMVEFRGETGVSYRLEASPTPGDGGEWKEVETFELETEARSFTIPKGASARRFFRVVKL